MARQHFRAGKGCDCDNVRLIIGGEGCVPHMPNVGQGGRLGRLDKPVAAELFFQDFRSGRLKGRDPRVAQLSPQVIAQQIGLDLIERLVQAAWL